jgi:hypothetical protein
MPLSLRRNIDVAKKSEDRNKDVNRKMLRVSMFRVSMPRISRIGVVFLTFLAMALNGFAASKDASALAPGDRLPELRGEYLSERKATLPADASGRVALLMLGFTYKSRFAVEDWGKRFRAEFEKNSQVTFYEIPMISGLGRTAKWFIDSGMRRGTPKSDYENVITVYGGTDPWKQRLNVVNEADAYLILLDPKGNVAWLHTGALNDNSYRELSEQVRKLVPAP